MTLLAVAILAKFAAMSSDVSVLMPAALQSYFAAPPVETINYSQFKVLVKKGLVANLVVGEKSIHGEIKPQGIKEALAAERLKVLEEAIIFLRNSGFSCESAFGPIYKVVVNSCFVLMARKR